MHKSLRHSPVLPGVDAISISSDRTFPRHSHDEFGFGYIVDGAQESWSGRGLVEAQAGDTITVNPAELHDGIGRRGKPRQWHMVFISPEAFERLSDVSVSRACFSRPVNHTRQAFNLAACAFAALTQDQPNIEHAEELTMLALGAQLESQEAGQHGRFSAEVQRVLDMIL